MSVRRRIGFLAENPYYYDYLTAEELLTYFARLFGYSSSDARTRVARVLDQVGLGRERRMRLRQFSKGMVQRVGLAQALLNDPEVVFLDEPMSGLDPLGRRDVRDLILSLRARGCTVFFSSHILSDAEALCDRVAIVAQGKLAASGGSTNCSRSSCKAWELVMSGVPAALHAQLASRFAKVTPLSHGRVAVNAGGRRGTGSRHGGALAPTARGSSRSTRSATRSKISSCSTCATSQPRATGL